MLLIDAQPMALILADGKVAGGRYFYSLAPVSVDGKGGARACSLSLIEADRKSRWQTANGPWNGAKVWQGGFGRRPAVTTPSTTHGSSTPSIYHRHGEGGWCMEVFSPTPPV